MLTNDSKGGHTPLTDARRRWSGTLRSAMIPLCAKVVLSLGPELKSRGRGAMTSDQRVASPDERYVYPDVTIVCGRPEFQAGAADVLVNPSILVEVLSKAMADYDRGLKWEGSSSMRSTRASSIFPATTPHPTRDPSITREMLRDPGRRDERR